MQRTLQICHSMFYLKTLVIPFLSYFLSPRPQLVIVCIYIMIIYFLDSKPFLVS